MFVLLGTVEKTLHSLGMSGTLTASSAPSL